MKGRPQPDEAAKYYFTYIDQVNGDKALQAIKNQLDEYQPFLSRITEEKSRHRYAPDKWSIRQVLNHVTDTERMFLFRALWFARGFEDPLPGFDQSVAAATAHADSIAWSAHLEEFKRVRLATISFFQNLPADAWARKGIASDNPFTVRALAFIIPGHAAHHFKILRTKYM